MKSSRGFVKRHYANSGNKLTVTANPSDYPFTGASPDHLTDVDEGDLDWSNAHADFLSSLMEEELQDLLNCSRRLMLKSRDYLFRAGDRSNNVYIVVDGCIRLFQVSSTGKETILWFNFPGGNLRNRGTREWKSTTDVCSCE